MSWRAQLPILVTDAHTTGAVAVIRSLGRAGYPVHATSFEPGALGLCSSYAAKRSVSPHPQAPEFLPWLREVVAREQIRAVVPSEAVLLAIQPCFEELAPLLPFSSRRDVVFAGMSKYDLFEQLDGTAHLPPTLRIADTSKLPAESELQSLGTPLYVKSDGVYALHEEAGHVWSCATAAEALTRLRELAPRFRKLLVQGHVGGQGVGAFFAIWNGKRRAEFMHRRLHEVPHTGGASSLRESWFHAAIHDDALAKLQAMRWEGVAMLEYRWDPASDAFQFLELNGRFWGSLHLALQSGVDFPKVLLDAFFGRPDAVLAKYPLGLRCRHTFPMEVSYVWSRLKDGALPLTSRLWSVLEFALLGLDPRVRSDLLFEGDSGLYWRALRQFLATTLG